MGPDLGIDVKKVTDLKPEIVLASLTVPGHEKVIEKLEIANLPYTEYEPIRLEDVYQDVLDIGDVLNVTGCAQQIVDDMQERIRSASQVSNSACLLL